MSTSTQLGEAQQLPRLEHREQLVDLELELVGKVGHRSATIERCAVDLPISPVSELVGTRGSTVGMPVSGNSPSRLSASGTRRTNSSGSSAAYLT